MATVKDSDPQSCVGLVEKKDEVADKEKTGVENEKTKACLKILVNGLAVLTIVLLLVLLGVTIAWYVVRVKDLAPLEHDICLPCSQLKGQYDHADVLGEFRKENDQCCSTTSKILKRLVAKTTTEKYSSDLANNFFASSSEKCENKIPEKPAAKVAGISFMEMKQDQAESTAVKWNSTSPFSFFKEYVKYNEGSLQVKKSGFYYIFNQMKWFLNNSDSIPIKHEIVVKVNADGSNKVLLEGRKSRCNLVEESGETTSSIGAVFELQELDEIFVTTSRPGDLAPCHHGNFFGLYQVADTLKV